MNCPDTRAWDLLAVEALQGPRREAMLAHAHTCQACRVRLEAARRDHVERMRMYEVFDRDHDVLREQLMAALPDELPRRQRAGALVAGWRRAGDYVMSMSRSTRRAAVVMIPGTCLIVIAGVLLLPDRESAFAAAIDQFKRAGTIACRVTTTLKLRMRPDPHAAGSTVDVSGIADLPENEIIRNEKLYLSPRGDVRRDTYEDGAVVDTTYTSRSKSTLVLHPADHTYERFDVDDELRALALETPGPDVHFSSLAESPDRLLRGMQELTGDADESLGRRTFDGHELIGYGVAGDKVGLGPPFTDRAVENRAELWVDPDTGSAARLVFHFVTRIPGMREMPLATTYDVTFVYDRFEWDPPLAPDGFDPVIPEGYTRRETGQARHMTMPDEPALITALRVFSEWAGRYPSSLNAMSSSYEVGALLGFMQAKRLSARRSGRSDEDIPDPATLGRQLQGLALYPMLAVKGRNPEYFGDTVRPGDAEAVLMRWTREDGGTRVIHGDLSVENVP